MGASLPLLRGIGREGGWRLSVCIYLLSSVNTPAVNTKPPSASQPLLLLLCIRITLSATPLPPHYCLLSPAGCTYLLVAVVPVVHFKLPTALRAVDDKSCVNDFIDEKAAAEAAWADAAVDAANAAAF